MKNNWSFILVPSVYNQPCKAELHLAIVNDNGMNIGVIASVTTLYHQDGRRVIQSESLDELQDYEMAIVIERVKKEISEGKIDKAFLYFVTQQKRSIITKEILDLFLLPSDDEIANSLCPQKDRIDALLNGVRDEYCQKT